MRFSYIFVPKINVQNASTITSNQILISLFLEYRFFKQIELGIMSVVVMFIKTFSYLRLWPNNRPVIVLNTYTTNVYIYKLCTYSSINKIFDSLLFNKTSRTVFF